MKGFLLTVFLVSTLFLGILWVRNDRTLPLPPEFLPPSTHSSPSKQTAGHAFTPNQYDVTTSLEWLWDPAGVYRLDPGSNIAQELRNEKGHPITNLQGLTYSLRGEALTDFYVWLWTPETVYRYHPSGEMVRMQDAAAQDIAGVQGVIVIPRPGHDDTVWLWTATNLYQLTVGAAQAQFVAHEPALGGLLGAKVTPDARFVWLWNLNQLLLYDLSLAVVRPVLNSAHVDIMGVRDVVVQSNDAAALGHYTVWVWNQSDLFRFPFPTTALPPFPEKLLNAAGGAINWVEGIWPMPMPSGEIALWVWTPWSLYQLVNDQAVPVTLAAGDVVLSEIHGVTACPVAAAYLYVWNAQHLLQVNPTHQTVQVIHRPDGAVQFNQIRKAIACPTHTPGEDVWLWDVDGVYRQIGQSPQTRLVLTQQGQTLLRTRGLMIGQHQQGQEIWLWNDGGVFQYQPTEDRLKEIVGPDGRSLLNVWVVMMRPDKTELARGYKVLIRNERSVFEYSAGNPRALSVLAAQSGASKTILSPPFTPNETGVVVVGHCAFSRPLVWPETTLNVVLERGEGGNAAAQLLAFASQR